MKISDTVQLGQRVRERRREAGLTLNEAAGGRCAIPVCTGAGEGDRASRDGAQDPPAAGAGAVRQDWRSRVMDVSFRHT